MFNIIIIIIMALRRALRRMAGLVFLLVFWVLAGACQRHGVGGFLLRDSPSSSSSSPRKTPRSVGSSHEWSWLSLLRP